jgi:hypothetical protein
MFTGTFRAPGTYILQSRTTRSAAMRFSMRVSFLFVFSAVLGFGGFINSYGVNPSLFDLTTFASGLPFPAAVQPLADGSVLVQTTPDYGYTPGQLLSFTSTGAGGGVVYTNSGLGLMTGSTLVGHYYASGTDTSEIGPGGGSSINLLQAGSTPSSPMSLAATLQLSYPIPWDHPSVGLAARPTPGVPGSYDLIINVGSQYDNVITPAGSTATLTGTGFSSSPTTSLLGNSLYKITIDENGAQPAVTGVQQVATGIRNAFGMTFDSAGNLWFSDNGMDQLPPGSSQPTPPPGEPPQADELNFLSAAQLAAGTPVDYGFPNCYTQYAWGSIPGVTVGNGCVQPVLAFQPVTDLGGIHQLIGATQVALAPSTFPDGFNDGVFVGFTGDGGLDNNGGLAYYDFGTAQYTQFIESTDVNNIIGVASSDNALFFTTLGNVYELTAASPEPGTSIMAALGLIAAGCWMKGRTTRSSNAMPPAR